MNSKNKSKNIFTFVYHWIFTSFSIVVNFIINMSFDTTQKIKKTVIERGEFSPNWEAFLKTQTGSKATPKKSKERSNSYYKSLRLEQKISKKPADIKNRQSDDSNKKMNSNIYESLKSTESVNFIKPKPKDSNDRPVFKNNNETNVNPANSKINEKSNTPVLTKFIAMDCEMVGIGEDARDSMLARVSLVNKFGDCLYDKFVQPRERVTDYRTPVSGVRKEDLAIGEKFEVVQKDVAEILKGRFLVGHALKNDIEVLFLSHPAHKIRDTSRYQLFRTLVKGGTPSLKKLSKELLGVDIQSGEHSSVEDARAAMQLYCLHSRQWEDTLARKRKLRKNDRKISS